MYIEKEIRSMHVAYSHFTSEVSAGSIFSIGGIIPYRSTRVAVAAFSPVFSSYSRTKRVNS